MLSISPCPPSSPNPYPQPNPINNRYSRRLLNDLLPQLRDRLLTKLQKISNDHHTATLNTSFTRSTHASSHLQEVLAQLGPAQTHLLTHIVTPRANVLRQHYAIFNRTYTRLADAARQADDEHKRARNEVMKEIDVWASRDKTEIDVLKTQINKAKLSEIHTLQRAAAKQTHAKVCLIVTPLFFINIYRYIPIYPSMHLCIYRYCVFTTIFLSPFIIIYLYSYFFLFLYIYR